MLEGCDVIFALSLVASRHTGNHLCLARVGLWYVDAVLDPVGGFAVAKALQVLLVIGGIIIGNKHALAIKALNKHTLAVKVAKAEWSVHLVAPLFASPSLNGVKQSLGNALVVDKVHLRKAHAAIAPFFIGSVAENCTDAPHDLAVLNC